MAFSNLDSIEYQVVVRPDSKFLKPCIKALVCAHPAKGRRLVTTAEVPKVSVEIPDLCKELHYDFIVSARYPTVGPREFTELFTLQKQSQITTRETFRGAPSSVFANL